MPPPPRPSSPRKEALRTSTPVSVGRNNSSSSLLSQRSSIPSRPPRRPISQQIRSQTPTKDMAATTPTSPTAGVRVTMGGVSPPAESPMIARPAPPNRTRSKRISVTPTNGTPTPRATPSPRPAVAATLPKEQPEPSSAPEPQYTGTIEDRTEDELEKASRTAMQDALRREWADREKFSTRIEELEAQQLTTEERLAELQKLSDSWHEKYDAAFSEQQGLEADLEAANDLIDRLRANVAESEKHNRQGSRRYADQEKAFEAERLVHQAELQHLQQRLKSLTTERLAHANVNEEEPHLALKEELASLSASHQTLVAQLTTLADELHEVKADNARLLEENDSWQLLVEERTLAGHMGSGLLTTSSPSRNSPPVKPKETTVLATLEEQMEMDELNAEMDIDASSPHPSAVELASPRLGNSLAAELNGDNDVEKMRTELKSLKESNKALTLYCSKILDRIIASEGFEHILSVDYRTRRFGTRNVSGRSIRPSVEEIARDMENGGPSGQLTDEPTAIAQEPAQPAAAPTVPPKSRARPMSMMVNPTPATASAAPEKKDEKEKATEEKRSRRGFSIDFRSLGFGSGPKEPEPKQPQLKPLTLASSAAPACPRVVSSGSGTSAASVASVTSGVSPTREVKASPVISARKLEPQEEDEEDRRERHRMEAALKLMGIERTPEAGAVEVMAPAPVPATPPEDTGSRATSWLRRLSRAPAQPAAPAPAPVPPKDGASSDSARSSTGTSPLQRLSVAFGTSSTADLANLADATPADAAAALKAFDAKEAQQAKLLAQGKAQAAYTVPPKIDRSARKRNTLGANGTGANGVNGAANGTANGAADEYTSKHQQKESVSTLWSVGSSVSADA